MTGGQASETDTRVAARARDLLRRGPGALFSLPTAAQLASERDTRRHRRLDDLRVELYAVSSLLADAAVTRATHDRHLAPPYGLVRSGHTDWRMILANPEPVLEGGIDSYYTLGKAYVDTVVVHLDREFRHLGGSGQGWVVDRLETMLALFRADATPQARARMRDPFSFVYGGLHFGSGVCVQLVEVMNRLLAPRGLTTEAKVTVLGRSIRPAYRLAALNVDQVVPAYETLLAPFAGLPGRGAPSIRWFDPAGFTVVEEAGQPSRVDLACELATPDRPTRWTTHGCPARISPTGSASPIGALWAWCVGLAAGTGLLD